jgi:anaerobic selenocysteine-containing dehydrogenase
MLEAPGMTDIGEEKVVRTVCGIEDGTGCGLLAHVKNGVLVKVEPADFPTPGLRHICLKCLCSPKLVYHPDRLQYPMRRVGDRGEGRWERISWDEAFNTIASKFREIGEKYSHESIAFITGLAWTHGLMSIYQRLASALQGTWVNISGYGDAAGPCGDQINYGSLIGNEYTYDFEDPGMCVIWGANYAETWPLHWRRIREVKEKGAKVVLIDPNFTTTASKADEYVPIRPGTDAALALGMMKVILDKGLADRPFMTQYTVAPFLVRGDNGLFLREKEIASGGTDRYMVWDTQTESARPYDETGVTPALEGVFRINAVECRPSFHLLTDLANQYPLEKSSEITEVPSETIERLAIAYATHKPVASYRGWGLQRTFHGDLTHRAISTLAALTGSIRLAGHRAFMLNREAMTTVMGRCFRPMPLMRVHEAVLTGQPYPIKALWVAAHNLMNQNADSNRVLREVLRRLEFIVVVDLFMNTSAQYADIVLPACSFYERLDMMVPFEVINPYLQLQPKVIEPLYESKSDFDIANELGSRMGFGEHFSRSAEEYIELLLSSGHPSVEGVTLERLKAGPVKVPSYEVPVFFTASGRVEFYSEAMKPFGEELPVYKEPLESARRPLAEKYPLSYFSTHPRFRKHSMFANVSWLRDLDPEPTVEMNPLDAKKRGIQDGDMVVVFKDRGKVRVKAKVHQGIRPGVVDIKEGWWNQDYTEGTHQALTQSVINPAQVATWEPNMAFYDNLVEVTKEEA